MIKPYIYKIVFRGLPSGHPYMRLVVLAPDERLAVQAQGEIKGAINREHPDMAGHILPFHLTQKDDLLTKMKQERPKAMLIVGIGDFELYYVSRQEMEAQIMHDLQRVHDFDDMELQPVRLVEDGPGGLAVKFAPYPLRMAKVWTCYGLEELIRVFPSPPD